MLSPPSKDDGSGQGCASRTDNGNQCLHSLCLLIPNHEANVRGETHYNTALEAEYMPFADYVSCFLTKTICKPLKIQQFNLPLRTDPYNLCLRALRTSFAVVFLKFFAALLLFLFFLSHAIPPSAKFYGKTPDLLRKKEIIQGRFYLIFVFFSISRQILTYPFAAESLPA